MSAVDVMDRTDQVVWSLEPSLPEVVVQAPVKPKVQVLARRAMGLMDACEQIDSMPASEERERALAALLECVQEFEAAPLMAKEAALWEAMVFCAN